MSSMQLIPVGILYAEEACFAHLAVHICGEKIAQLERLQAGAVRRVA